MNGLKKATGLFIFVLIITLGILLVGETSVEASTKKAYINYARITMTKGYSMKLKVKGTSKKVKWRSSNKNVATVNKKGKVTGKKNGKCVVTAKVNGKKLKCKVTVKKINNKTPKAQSENKYVNQTLNVTELKLDISKATYDDNGKLNISETAGTYDLEVLNVDSSKEVEWKSSNEQVAVVDDGQIKAVSKGKCTITATVEGVVCSCEVYITNLKNAQSVKEQEYVYEMLGLINIDRVKVKAAPLKIRDEVNKIADIRANETVDFFSHTRPDGREYRTAYGDAGVEMGSIVGENLAYIKGSPKGEKSFVRDVYKNLYASKAHRENMLNPEYEYIGMSVCKLISAEAESGKTYIENYWAQEFYTK